MRDCPDCDAQLGPTGGCKRCGWEPTSEKPVVKEMQPLRCQHGTIGQRCEQCDAIAAGFIEKIHALLPTPDAVASGRDPIYERAMRDVQNPDCAGCSNLTGRREVTPGQWVYRDNRLWHPSCWNEAQRRGLVQ